GDLSEMPRQAPCRALCERRRAGRSTAGSNGTGTDGGAKVRSDGRANVLADAVAHATNHSGGSVPAWPGCPRARGAGPPGGRRLRSADVGGGNVRGEAGRTGRGKRRGGESQARKLRLRGEGRDDRERATARRRLSA